MPKFDVIVSRMQFLDLVVEAEDFLQAQDEAIKMMKSGDFEFEFDSHPESYDYKIYDYEEKP